MTIGDLLTLFPFVVLAATPVAVMLAIAFYRNHLLVLGLTLLGLGISLATLSVTATRDSRQVTALIVMDNYTLYYMGLVLVATAAVAGLSYRYLERRRVRPEEFYILLLLASLGAAVLVASSQFASFFLGLEILSVSLYGLIAYPKLDVLSIEAGTKYLILAATSAAFLLFGMALVYEQLGTMELSRIASAANSLGKTDSVILIAGLGMIIIGIGYKLALVPFHLWTPDIYEGAPAPISGFVATISKGAMFALLLRLFSETGFHLSDPLFVVFSVIAVASMALGNLLALLQNNVKRILAYSSIAHLGYLLVAFLATSGDLVIKAVGFYLIAYFLATLSAFGVITVLSGGNRDADSIEDYRSLFWTRPWLGGLFTAALLSLAGIPLTAGFLGKIYLLTAGIGSDRWLLVAVLIATSVAGLFYYLRVVIAMYVQPERDVEALPLSRSLAGQYLVLGVLGLLLVWLGVYPAPLIHVIQDFGH